MFWVANRDADGKAYGKWVPPVSSFYTYRTLLPNEILFDIGDHADWAHVREAAHAVKAVLDSMGLDPMLAGSGGNGAHIHVFFREPLDHREYFVDWVVDRALDLMGHEFGDPEIIADMGVTDCPNPARQMVREFGARKEYPKTLVEGDLPREKAKVYEKPVVIPNAIRFNEQPWTESARESSRALGGACPKSEACWTTIGGCDKCPTNK